MIFSKSSGYALIISEMLFAIVRLSVTALWRHRLRTALTMLGITIGIAAVVCTASLGAGSAEQIQQQLDQLGDNFVWIERGSFTPDPTDRSTWIHIARGSYFLTSDLYVRLFFQTNSTIDRQNLQAAFVYRYLPPFGTLQLVYQRGTAALGQRSDQGHTLFLKATTVF